MSPSENKVYFFILTLSTGYGLTLALRKFTCTQYVPFNNKINGFCRVQLDLLKDIVSSVWPAQAGKRSVFVFA